MATFSAKVLKHQRRADGTYNVKIIVCHQKKRKYLDTEFYVSDRMLTKDRKIKDPIIIKQLNVRLDDYRSRANELGEKLKRFNVEMLWDHLNQIDGSIDFLKFCRGHVQRLRADGREKSASNYSTVANSLEDFFGRPTVRIAEITVGMLKAYERFLRSPRKMTRNNGHGGFTTLRVKAMTDAGVHDYLRELSGFFSAAMDHFNRPSLEIIPITYNPFKEFKIIEPPQTKKRNLKPKQIIAIRDCKTRTGSRAELARDMFMLSFYLCGMNAKDIYAANYKIENGRLEYNRSKTKDKRKDSAFISIRIPQEATELLAKSKRLRKRYKSITNLNKALSKGMQELQKITHIAGITLYWARHSFGNIARNICRKSKDDVALALNHVDQGRRTTDIYLEHDWTIVDEVQNAALGTLHQLSEPSAVISKISGRDITNRLMSGITLLPLKQTRHKRWSPLSDHS